MSSSGGMRQELSNRNSECGGAVFSVFLLAMFMSIVGAGIMAFSQLTHTNPLSPSFLEETPPELQWHEEPRGLGAEAAKLSLRVSDKDSGLDEIIVRISQKNQPRELVRKKFDSTQVKQETIDFMINPKELGFREGNVELQVLAFDKALWNNGSRLSKIVEVNFLKPQIAVLTPQQNGVLGGSELVFYKVTGKAPDTQGVVGQGSLYPGFKAEGWSDEFAGHHSVYLAFYPIPASFREGSDSMQIVARDNLGNSANAPFNYRIRNRSWSSFRTSFSEEQASKLKESLVSYAQREKISMRPTGNLINDFKALLKLLAVSDESFLGAALAESEPRRLWHDAFSPPAPSAPNNSAGDQRVVMVGTQEVLRGAAAGVRFPVSRRTPVTAANGGKVAFIGELGLLGNTIVIDHGLGLSTVYGHLSDVQVQRGTMVEKGGSIGNTGTTGLAQSEEVYFETRLHGVPVSPNEWWDQTWVTDHIENKVAFVQRDLTGK